MKPKIFIGLGVLLLLTAGFGLSVARAASVSTIKMRIVVVNPSAAKPQVKTIKNYLPKEIKAADIRDAGGLEVEYDAEQGAFFVFKNDVELAPGESKTFEITLEDVWRLPDEKIEQYKKRTDNILKHLQDTPYFNQANLVAKTVYGRLEDIAKTQSDNAVSKTQHIAYYRENVKTVESIQHDIDELEKILVAVGGTPNLELVEKSDINLKSPSSKTTWIIIFVILIFIAILAGAFYFTWQSQSHVTENIFTKEKESAFSEFKKSGESPPGEAEKK